jgi:hypothetical protein
MVAAISETSALFVWASASAFAAFGVQKAAA